MSAPILSKSANGEDSMTHLCKRRGLVTFALFGASLLMAACGTQAPPPTAPTASPKLAPHFTAAAGTGAAVCTGPDVHQRHLAQFACDTCHATGGIFAFGPFTPFPRGTTTTGGTIAKGAGTTPTTCTVACHYPMGAAAHPVAWNSPAPLACTNCHDTSTLAPAHPAVTASATRADCQGCHAMGSHMGGTVALVNHGAAWMDRASAGFHAYSANQGLSSCQGCHGPDLSGGVTGFSCAQCHDSTGPSGPVSWRTNCVMCHGGTDSSTGAPPRATWGQAADPVRVGAHSKHLAASAIAPTFGCNTCHAVPADALTPGHVDGGTAEVVFGGIAGEGSTPTWTRSTATCSSVYCHGSTLKGGTNTSPSWTGGAAQAACGTCHGLPPPSPHPAVSSSLAGCSACHPQTMDAGGNIIAPSAGGKHLDGVVEASGGHGASWMDRTSAGFHAYSANASLASCQGCHGAALDGVGGSATTSCASCHGATWKTNCTMCHGGTANLTGAPPKATWGQGGDPLRVGSHTKHVTAGAIAGAFDCAVCHLKPANALSPGHVDGSTATVTWGGISASSGANPGWDRTTGTCASTYCHGGYASTYTYTRWDYGCDCLETVTFPYTGGNGTPNWTGAPMTCASCHGNPPRNANWHSGSHGGGNSCDLCHPDVNAAGTAITNPALHLNGVVDVASQWKSSCFNCH